MKKGLFVCAALSTVFAFATPTLATVFTFDDFSSLTMEPELTGYLSNAGFEATLSGDAGRLFTDPRNGSLNALILGDKPPHNPPHNYTAQLTISFNLPVTELVMEFDAMQGGYQGDTVTASTGAWTSFPATLSLSGQTLISTAVGISPGGSGVDDDLLATLTFATPVNSITFTSAGAFAMDAFTANVVPEPMTASLLALGGLALVRRRRYV